MAKGESRPRGTLDPNVLIWGLFVQFRVGKIICGLKF